MQDTIHIGTILKPQGILGELKLKDFSNGPDSIAQLSTVVIDQKNYKVLAIRSFSGFIYITVAGVYDRNMAELLRGKEVFALREEIVKGENEYFIVDVIGCDLFLSSGKCLGKVVNVTQARFDIYEVSTVEGTAVFPMLKELLPIFDVENKKITVDSKKFTEVVMYEN